MESTYRFLGNEAAKNAEGYEETAREWDKHQAKARDFGDQHECRINARRCRRLAHSARNRSQQYHEIAKQEDSA